VMRVALLYVESFLVF